MFLVTQLLWTHDRMALAVTILNTMERVLPAHATSGREVSAVPGKHFRASLSKKRLARFEKTFCTSSSVQLFTEKSLQKTALELPSR